MEKSRNDDDVYAFFPDFFRIQPSISVARNIFQEKDDLLPYLKLVAYLILWRNEI